MEQTDKKISQMAPLQTVSGDEIVPVVKSGGNYSALVSQIVALARQTMVEAQAGKGLGVYAIVGDGEVEEGECWEAFMFAAHYGLSNLCVFLDRNHLQIDGTTETVMNSAPLEEKLKAFNFNVITINGHDYDQIEAAIKAFHAETEKPTCIVMDTLKGKGVSFMENAVDWHGKGPNDEEYEIAMKELNAAYAALEEEDK